MQRKLTQAAAEKIAPPAIGGRRLEIYDSLTPGLALRVSASGSKSWIVFYRVKGGERHRRHTIGKLADFDLMEARKIAGEIRHDAVRGIDPDEPKPTTLTVADLAAQFIEGHAKRNKSWRLTEALLRRHVLPTLGKRPAVDISKQDIRQLLAQAAKVAPVGVNRVLAHTRKMFGWAAEQDIITASPVIGVKALAKETSRERVLSDDELTKVWRGADALPVAQGAFLKLLILTAQRRDEVATMRWADINGDTWTLPREATKGDRTHEVPLSAMALDIINTLPRDGTYVLSTTAGAKPISGYSKLKRRLALDIGDWRLHDLRRTAGTGMATCGVPVSTISRVLNHSEGGVTRIYNRYSYGPEKRIALDTWARKVEELLVLRTEAE